VAVYVSRESNDLARKPNLPTNFELDDVDLAVVTIIWLTRK
jgi:hypothetical protein